MIFDTIIIGAGLAGLSAGQWFMNNGHDNFLVLESSPKIGGRIQTAEFDGKRFTIGPGWIHGVNGNPIYNLALELGIQVKKCEYGRNSLFVCDGKYCGENITENFFEKSFLLDEMYENVSAKVSTDEIDPAKSILDVLCEHYEAFRSKDDVDKVVMFLNKEIYQGASLSQVSAKVEFQKNSVYSLDDEEINFRVTDPSGMTKMTEFMAKTFPDKIILNSKVTKIVWNHEKHSATIYIDNGLEYHCNNVIITLQSELLAKNSILFEPPIPHEKLTAWQHVPTVDYCRIFAKFPRKFWPNCDWLVSIPENVDPFDELILWQNGEKQNLCSGDDNILICHYTSAINKGKSRFDVDKDKLKELVAEAMKNMFPDTFCTPDDVTFISYRNQSGYGGAYSIPACGLDDELIKALSDSVGPLHFAGESVSVDFIGTMQAAYVTGREAAERTLV